MDDIDVVADSEGEELGFAPPKARREDVSSIDTTVSSGQTRPSSIVTATTSFVASLDALLNANVEENATGRPKPRPRPKFRNQEKGRAGIDASTAFTNTTTTTPHTQLEDDMDFPNILSIADRAKMRQRTAKPSSLSYGQSAHYFHTSDDEDELSHSYHVPDGDEESNDKLHNKPKTKTNLLDDFESHESDPLGSFGKVIYEPNPTLPPQPPPRPYTPDARLEKQSPTAQTRPKPRPIQRSNKAKSSPTAAGAQHQPTSPSFIPIATSPLPPSDPPLPFSSSHQHDAANADHREINVYDDSLPPIESLPAPTSSPSSLFSAAVADEGEDAHITGGTDINRTSPGLDETSRFLDPPSTFFKGASSLDHPSPPKPKERKRKQREEQVEVIDLCTVPPKCTDIRIVDLKEIDKKGTKTKGRKESDGLVPEIGKAKGKDKRKASDHDDFGICAEDDGDDDYEDSAKRKKVKTKTKGKKAEGKLSTKPKKSVEVIVEVPTLKRAGKQQVAEVPSAEDDIEQPLAEPIADEEARLSTSRVLGTSSRSIKGLDPGSPVSPVPDSEGEDMQGLFDMEIAAAKSKGTPVASTLAPSTSKKRRKRVVSDDEEEQTYDGKEEDERAASPKKKAKKKERPAQTQGKSKARTRKVVLSDDGENHEPTATTKDTEGVDDPVKENIHPHSSGMSSSASKPTSSSHAEITSPAASDKPDQVKNLNANADTNAKIAKPQPTYNSLTSRYTIAPKTRSTPMSELIRRANSKPLSPLTSPPRFHTKVKDANKSTPTPTPTRPSQGVTAYSPYLKASRSFLSRIAPLHPNRRTPPPPPPPPPPRKKSKKELELEEKWEEELIDSVGGSAAWSCLSEDERKEMKRHKWAVERGEIDD
ncbi:hypothetical protein JOM56_001082 [Amanita muscaria]